VIALLVDLRRAFNFMGRKELVKAIKDREVREVERIEETLGETRYKVRCGEKVGKEF